VDRLLRWLQQHCGWRRYTSAIATPATLKASIGAAFRAMRLIVATKISA
jgi:hypothetical protein